MAQLQFPSGNTARRIAIAVASALLVAIPLFVFVFGARFAWQRLHVRESDVYGVYVANYENGTETVTINADHTYVQEVSSPVLPEVVRNASTWIWINNHFGDIQLRGCWVLTDLGSGVIKSDFSRHQTSCSYPFERDGFLFVFGTLVLGLSEDPYAPRKVR